MAQLYHTLMKDLKKAVPKMGYKFKDKAGEDLFFFLTVHKFNLFIVFIVTQSRIHRPAAPNMY